MTGQELREQIKKVIYKKLKEEFIWEYRTTLTKDNLEEIKKFIEKQEVEVAELDSAQYDPNPYGLESHLASATRGEYNYDEDEYYLAQVNEALDTIKNDYAREYLDFCKSEDEDEDWEEKIQEEVIRVLEAMADEKKIIVSDEEQKPEEETKTE